MLRPNLTDPSFEQWCKKNNMQDFFNTLIKEASMELSYVEKEYWLSRNFDYDDGEFYDYDSMFSDLQQPIQVQG